MINTSTYLATVTFNNDPEQLGRIRVACAGLLGDEESEIPIDIEPIHDWGWFYIPDIGETVEIEVTEGASDDEQNGQISIDNIDIKWRSARVYGNTETDTPTPINEEFTSSNYGKRRGFATPTGHVFMFDDKEGSETIRLKWKNANGDNCLIEIDKDGTVLLSNKVDTKIELNGTDGQVTITCPKAVIDANNIELAGNTEQVLLGTTFFSLFNSHTHPTPAGPSSVPTNPLPSSVLSNKVKTE